MKHKVFIYGSCVSRDAFETFGDDYQLLGYIARQSLISAMTPPTTLLDGDELDSKFQNRSLKGDLASNLLPSLRRYASQIDVLLVDLTDERLGVMKLSDGSYITRSHELVSSGRLDRLHERPMRSDFTTERHFELWSSAAATFCLRIEAMGLLDKTLVLNTPWATHLDTGDIVPEFRIPTSEVNQAFAHYFDFLRKSGVNVYDLPAEASVSTLKHKWGPAPYHFGPAAAQYISAAVAQRLDDMKELV